MFGSWDNFGAAKMPWAGLQRMIRGQLLQFRIKRKSGAKGPTTGREVEMEKTLFGEGNFSWGRGCWGEVL